MRIAAAALFTLLLSAPAAHGQATTTATPNQAGKATRLHTELDATQPPILGRIPRETVLSIQSGYRLDGRAVAARCTTEQGAKDACPAKSAIGTAQVVATYMGSDVPIPIQLYLAKPQQAGDVAGFIAVARVLGSTYAAAGRVTRTTEAPFGLAVILPTPGPDASSFGATLKSITADIGAMRAVKTGPKGKRKKVRYSLLTNPATCTGTWASRAALTFSDGTTAQLDAPISCIP